MVRSGRHRSTPDVEYAVKCVNIARLKEEDVSALRDKVNILLLLRECKHITHVYDHFDKSPKKFYLVMATMSGGGAVRSDSREEPLQ
jgi:hypothetical protein